MGNGMIITNKIYYTFTDSENTEILSDNGITHILSVYNSAKPLNSAHHWQRKFLCYTLKFT
uniref:Uncharacterized protein n=1 Tax=Paramormyrops kingsleyae TaxID=1676925 RepID=A0A3B3QTI1_9TELE